MYNENNDSFFFEADDLEEFEEVCTNDFGKFISREKINEKLNAWKNEKLNIAIIGETKSGKSNLINVMRGIFPKDPRASPIKVTQETNFPKPYADTKYPNIIFWDTPGYNGIKSASTAQNYMEDIDNFIKNLSIIPRDRKQEFEYIRFLNLLFIILVMYL
jgi:predicted GTPase